VPKSQFTDAYAAFLEVLVAARKDAGFTQVELAEALGKPQNWVSNVERGVRRLDVIELIVVARALGHDPKAIFASTLKVVPNSTST